jgi:uncharacterized repeat protein (TIGR03803 family)
MDSELPPHGAVGLRVFISYRHEDSQSYARGLYQELSSRLPDGQVFWDISTIAPGLDFVVEIERAVGSCDVLLAVIAKHWLDSVDAAGARRLDDPKDFVRLEIATALSRDIRVVPVLVQGATMPTENELPEAIVGLARRNAAELSDRRWNFDVEQLVGVLKQIRGKPLEPRTGRLQPIVGADGADGQPAAARQERGAETPVVGAARSASPKAAPAKRLFLGAVAAVVVVIAAAGIGVGSGLFRTNQPASLGTASSGAGVAAGDLPAIAAIANTAAPVATTVGTPQVAAPDQTPVPAVPAKPAAPATVGPTVGARPAVAQAASPQVVATTQAGAITFSVLHGFNGKDGAGPKIRLLQTSDGNFYGTTPGGGDDGNGCPKGCEGTVFEVSPQGQFTLLHAFAWPYDGGGKPLSGLVEGPDGYLYGTTSQGGATNYGTVYKISKSGDFQKLHDFCQPKPLCAAEGQAPEAGLIAGRDGNLYGKTSGAGPGNAGTVFRISPSGDFATVGSFTSANGGAGGGNLIQASDGSFYGVNATLVYRVTSDGQVAIVYRFDPKKSQGTGGGDLLQAKDGNLYGVASNPGSVYRLGLDGTYTQIHLLSPAGEGTGPNSLVQTSDGNLWSSTSGGTGGGAVITITTDGTLLQATFVNTKLMGVGISAALIQASDGRLYGTTSANGSFPGGQPGASGTVFVVDASLHPVLSAQSV